MTKITCELSIQSLEKVKKQLQDFKDKFPEAINKIVKTGTEMLYLKVIENCEKNNLGEFVSAINWEYDETINTGRVWVKAGSYSGDDYGLIIILNEFGTGIKGAQDNYANEHDYKVNMSGKGDKGWWYPTTSNDPNPYKWIAPDGQLRALTHGVRSKHMFYEAFQEVKEEFGDIINIELEGTIGKIGSD